MPCPYRHILFALVVLGRLVSRNFAQVFPTQCRNDQLLSSTCFSPDCLDEASEIAYCAITLGQVAGNDCVNCVDRVLLEAGDLLQNSGCSAMNNANVCRKMLECPCGRCSIAALDVITCAATSNNLGCIVECQYGDFDVAPCYNTVKQQCNCGLWRRGGRQCHYSTIERNDFFFITGSEGFTQDDVGVCQLPVALSQATVYFNQFRQRYRRFCRKP